MKRILILSIFSAFAFNSFSQTATTPPPSQEVQKPEEKLRKLNLSPEQKAKMKDIQVSRKEMMKKRHQENREFNQNLNNKTKADVDAILTPEQKVKMDSLRAERKAHRMENRKNNPNRGNGHKHSRRHQPRSADSTAR